MKIEFQHSHCEIGLLFDTLSQPIVSEKLHNQITENKKVK